MKLRVIEPPTIEGCLNEIACEVGLADDEYRLYHQGTIRAFTVPPCLGIDEKEFQRAIFNNIIEFSIKKVDIQDCESTIEIDCNISYGVCGTALLSFVSPRRQTKWANKLYDYLKIKAKEECIT